MIPKQVTEEQMWTALKPFYDLLDITPNHVYAAPMPERDDDGRLHIRFQHVMEPDVEMDWPTGQTGDGEFDEKTYEVDITVTGDNSLQELWPGLRPEAARAGAQA